MRDQIFELTPGFSMVVFGATCLIVYFHRARVRFSAWMGAGFLGAGVINLSLALTAIGIPLVGHPAHKPLVLVSMAFMLVGGLGSIASFMRAHRSGTVPLKPPLRGMVVRDLVIGGLIGFGLPVIAWLAARG